jgi:hypothetical protein
MINGILDSNQKIVSNGLVLNLDAAQLRSYPTSGTAWTDLSGNANNGTLTNGPTFDSANGGSIVFDGTNDYVTVTGSNTFTEATFIAWMLRVGSQSAYDGIIHSRGGTGGSVTGMNFNLGATQLGYTWNNELNTYSWNSGLIIPATWCMSAITVNSTTAIAYLGSSSGFSSATNSVTHNSTTLAALSLARDNQGRYFKGNIAISLLYNRALSETEITQNYNAVKSRFGL